jgi:hypothetical protein
MAVSGCSSEIGLNGGFKDKVYGLYVERVE